MKLSRVWGLFTCSLAFLLSLSAAAVDTSQLIEIDKMKGKACVQYFLMEGKGYCSEKVLVEGVSVKKPSPERLKFTFDEQAWMLKFEVKAAVETHEYFKADEPVEAWTELVTTHLYPNIDPRVSPKQLAADMMENYKKMGYEPKVTVHQNKADDYIYEWTVSTDKHTENELQRIFRKGKLIHALRYTSKKADMGAPVRTAWLARLKAATVK